jgi:hypothetical protein
MDSSELLRIRLANRLLCASQQISVGPTGPTGGVGPQPTLTGQTRGFTIYFDYSSGTGISRVYIPPGLLTNIPAGGTFTANQGSDLVFLGTANIILGDTIYPFVCGMLASGYISAGRWQPVPPAAMNPSAGTVTYSVSSDSNVSIVGLDAAGINGGNISTRPTTGVAAGFLGSVTIFYG